MSAMTEAYDMPMADFSGDFDIQMQPSTSDPWYQELETKMEEDGPNLFKIDDSPSKNMAISQEKADGGIEVDMEPFIEEYNTEYEMVDDEHFHAPGDLHDVELHDADVSIELEESHVTPVPSLPLPHSVSTLSEGFTIESTTIENASLQPSVTQTEVPSIHSENIENALDDTASAVIPDPIDAPQETIPPVDPIAEFHIAEEEHPSEHSSAPAVSATFSEEAAVSSREAHTPSPPEQQEPTPILPVELATEPTAAPQEIPVETHVPSESAGLDEPHVDNEAEATEVPPGVDLVKPHDESDLPETPHVGGENLQEAASDIVAATGDPHEISEGVYIDPPPPILLSLGSDDNFDLCLFNNGEDALHKNQANDHVLLANFPTLYYESLSYIFEALRCEERVYQAFNLAECELILEAPDLQLTVSEDNIHARDVTLHDLNILHDVSGLDGLLRIRLSQSSPRFIYRYQRLQEEVNRLHLDVGPDEVYTAEVGDGDPSISNNDHEQDRLTGEHQEGEEVQVASELHHETQDDSQPDDQGAYAEESYVTGDETIYHDADGDFPRDDGEHNEDDSNSGELETSSYHHLNEAGSIQSGLNHNTTDDQVVNENQFELSNSADLGAVHQLDEVDVVTGGEYPADDNAEPEFGDEGNDNDVDGGGDEFSGFDDVEHVGVDGGEYQAVGGDAKGNGRADNAPTDGETDAVGLTNTSGNVSTNDIEGVRGAEDYSLEDLGDGVHNDPTYDPEEISSKQDDYEEEEHYEALQDDEESTTANTTTGYSEKTNPLEPSVLKEEVLQDHGDRQAESEALDDVGIVASGSSQNLHTDHLSSYNAHDLVEGPHLDPPEHSHDFKDDAWEGEFDEDGEFEDDTWDEDGAEKDNENTQSHSNESSVTLSSKASKRSFHEFELDDEGYQDESGIYGTPPSSPGAKRTRTH